MLNFFENEHWQTVWLGNTLQDYIESFVLFLVLIVVFGVTRSFILWRVSKFTERTDTKIDDTALKAFKNINPPLYTYLAFYLAARTLEVHELLETVIFAVLLILVVVQVIKAVQIVIDFVLEKVFIKRYGNDAGVKAAISLLGNVTRGVLWAFGGLVVLQNLGVEVTSLIAGLGIGGIALALAAQNVLSDLFSSFSIVFDKPFELGDFIIAGSSMGTVQQIGIKTTRLKALDGEELVIPNQDLTSTRIQNYKKMRERRIVFRVGVLYETPQEKLEEIPKMVEEIINDVEQARFDRCHFSQFDDSALTFETVYYVESGNYAKYMDINQEILFGINKAFAEKEISIAYPTRTVYMSNPDVEDNKGDDS